MATPSDGGSSSGGRTQADIRQPICVHRARGRSDFPRGVRGHSYAERSTAPAGRRTYPSPAADSRLAAFNYPIRVVLEGQKAIRRLLRADERAGRRCRDLYSHPFGQ